MQHIYQTYDSLYALAGCQKNTALSLIAFTRVIEGFCGSCVGRNLFCLAMNDP